MVARGSQTAAHFTARVCVQNEKNTKLRAPPLGRHGVPKLHATGLITFGVSDSLQQLVAMRPLTIVTYSHPDHPRSQSYNVERCSRIGQFTLGPGLKNARAMFSVDVALQRQARVVGCRGGSRNSFRGGGFWARIL